MHIIHTFTSGDIDVVLSQRADGTFDVVYGSHKRKRMPYGRAAAEYGECVFHSLACASMLDNGGEDNTHDCTFKGA